jgi:hypothetical protein
MADGIQGAVSPRRGRKRMGASGTTGESAAAMRVLICDQESEMLERVARSFEVDVATTKATCIDLMRANAFDVLVASERLSDGSGLELLSHVATRWPDTLRVLAIEPARLKIIRGKLGPFRLHATMRYPIDEDELEATLLDLDRLLEERADDAPEEAPAAPPPKGAPPRPTHRPSVQQSPPKSGAASAPNMLKVQKVQLPQQAARPSATPTRTPTAVAAKPASLQPRQSAGPAAAARAQASAPRENEPGQPVRRRLGNYTPLGAPEDEQMRIVERTFDQTMAPLAARAIRTREEASRPRTSGEKARLFAGQLSRTLRRLLKR